MNGEIVDSKGGAVRQKILALCAEALSAEAVRAEDNFFELGGDSLSAMWFLSSVQEEFMTEVPLAELFDAQTMGDVIAVIERHLPSASSREDASPAA